MADDSKKTSTGFRKGSLGRFIMPASRTVTCRLSSRSRIVIPKPVREFLGIGPGDVIAFEERRGEILIRALHAPARSDPFGSFDEWSGSADEEAYASLAPLDYTS
jgi:AbrB family looped-hinge helix DNA binding protein